MIIIMLGAPGTGKGTVAEVLSQNLDIKQVSTGDIFRKAIKEGTELGLKAEEYMSRGDLVPDEITIKIVEDRLKKEDVAKGAILDGFPRTVAQAEELERFLDEHGRKVDYAINLFTPEEELIERVVNRRICSNPSCRTIYNIKLSPPKVEGVCDKCGGKVIQREDDNVETVKNRLETYKNTADPIIDFYESRGLLYTAEVSQTINKMGKDVAVDFINSLEK